MPSKSLMIGALVALAGIVAAHADNFKFDLNEQDLRSLATTKESAAYENATKELTKRTRVLGEIEALAKKDARKKKDVETDRKKVEEAKAAVSTIRDGILARIKTSTPSGTVSVNGITEGLSQSCDMIEIFAEANGLGEIGFLGVCVWRDGKPVISTELSDAIRARLEEGKIKWSDYSHGVPDDFMRRTDTPPALLVGEIVDDPVHAGKWVSLRLLESRRMLVMKSCSWLVPKDKKQKGKYAFIFNDRTAAFYKSAVLRHETKYIAMDMPPAVDALQSALAKQMISDAPDCELIETAFVKATTGLVAEEPVASVKNKIELLFPRTENGVTTWSLKLRGSSGSPVAIGSIEIFPAK